MVVIWTMMAMNLLYEFILMRQFHFITRCQRKQPIVSTRLLYRYSPIETIKFKLACDRCGHCPFQRERSEYEQKKNKFHIKEDFHYSIFRIMIFRNLLYWFLRAKGKITLSSGPVGYYAHFAQHLKKSFRLCLQIIINKWTKVTNRSWQQLRQISFNLFHILIQIVQIMLINLRWMQ